MVGNSTPSTHSLGLHFLDSWRDHPRHDRTWLFTLPLIYLLFLLNGPKMTHGIVHQTQNRHQSRQLWATAGHNQHRVSHRPPVLRRGQYRVWHRKTHHLQHSRRVTPIFMHPVQAPTRQSLVRLVRPFQKALPRPRRIGISFRNRRIYVAYATGRPRRVQEQRARHLWIAMY
jgi:hypothetical protein